MASYRGHLAFSTGLGVAFGGVAWWQFGVDWATAVLAAELTALGGLLPDLDSDSGVPVRELFGLAACLTPILLLRRLQQEGLSIDQILVVLSAVYLIIRYGVATLFKHFTVHRGMYHSIPAMFNSGLVVFLLYHDPNVRMRALLGIATMIGFLSHLVLDELCSVNIVGVVPRLNKYAGSALKFFSPSWAATVGTYALLCGLVYGVAMEFEGTRKEVRQFQQKTLQFWAPEQRPVREVKK